MQNKLKEMQETLIQQPKLMEFMKFVIENKCANLILEFLQAKTITDVGGVDGFKKFVANGCEQALLENEEYMIKERSGKVSPDDLQAEAEEICFSKGFLLGIEFSQEMTKGKEV